MTSTATAGYMQMNHPHGMGPPGMGGPMGHPAYNHMLQQQQQQQQGGPIGGPSQMKHGPGLNQMGMPNQWQGMYQGPHPGQQMYNPQGYPGQQRPGFMPAHSMQVPPQQQQAQPPAPVKKPSKRKSNQQKHQEAVAAMTANTSNAAPPPKQPFLNPIGGPPVGFNGNANFPGGAQPNQMNSHLSPYHSHSQHAQQQAQMQAMNDWNRQQAIAAVAANNARSNPSRNESIIRGEVRSKLHASIHNRQNASPQQMAAMMSPNDIAAAAFGRYPAGTNGPNPNNSISPPTMMSPSRSNQIPQNTVHAASNYSPQSVPSMPTEQIHHPQQQQQSQQGHPMFSPKMQQQPQGFYHQNGNNQMNNGFIGSSGQNNHNGMINGMTHVLNPNELPQVTLEDCKAILQETDFVDFDSIGFDMTNKQGFDFNYDESRTLLQRILS